MNALCWRVAQAGGCLVDVGQAVAHVTSAKVTVDGLSVMQVLVEGKQINFELCVQLIEGRSVAYSHVINLVDSLGCMDSSGKQVGLHRIVYKAKVAASLAVAVDVDRLAFDHAANPLWDDCGISAIGVLAGAEDVEVAQAYALAVRKFCQTRWRTVR